MKIMPLLLAAIAGAAAGAIWMHRLLISKVDDDEQEPYQPPEAQSDSPKPTG